MKKYRSLAETYTTGKSYNNKRSLERAPYSTVAGTYMSLYTEESVMSVPNFGSKSVNWHKYRSRLMELISHEDADLKIHKKFHTKYGIDKFNSSMIINQDELLSFIQSMDAGVAPRAAAWPTINVQDGDGSIKIQVGHLTKTGQFTEEKQGQSSTDVKEGLVSLFFSLKHEQTVTKDNFDQVCDSLKKGVQSLKLAIGESDSETPAALDQITNFLADIEGMGDTARFRHELNQPLSQAVTILQSPYKNWIPTRGSVFHDVREMGRVITKFPADKWCPGDIYFINPELSDQIDEAIARIKSDPGAEQNLNILNDLFITDWGNIDRPILAVSLKFKNAQGGKAKDFLKKFIDEGTKDKPYNMDEGDLALDEPAVAAEIMRLRESISNHINTKGTDVRIVFDTTNDTVELERDPKRLREKFASLKLVDFLFDKADTGGLDDVIVGAIGFGLSLAGVNPTFFKVVANTKGTAVEDPEKFSEKGAIALYPVQGDDDPMIYIKDNNTSNKVEINCNIELGPDIKKIMLSARSNGYKQSTFELERVN